MASCLSHKYNPVGKRPRIELADILKRYLATYLAKHRISLWQHKILYDIQICRTAACGGHLETCDHCDYQRPAYNSCHNRHCPKCQGIARRKWVSARLKELLPVPYYHVVFTMPHRLNTIALYNKQVIYNTFYQAAAYTLLKFGRDAKFLGAQLGFTAVLHTWGKGLIHHVHWHFIVPGGGLTKEDQWVHLPYSDKFLFPPKAMSKVIRGRFIKLFKRAYYEGKISIPDTQEALKNPRMLEYFMNDLAGEEWVSYCKPPFGSPEQVIKYIGRYTHRVALANNRLIDIDGGRIRFYAKDHKESKRVIIELTTDEFIRRLLLHILPKDFRKIRYGGFLAAAIRDERIKAARQALTGNSENASIDLETDSDILASDGIGICPKCHIGLMRAVEIDKHSMYSNFLLYMDSFKQKQVANVENGINAP
jgi:hypothetical protein